MKHLHTGSFLLLLVVGSLACGNRSDRRGGGGEPFEGGWHDDATVVDGAWPQTDAGAVDGGLVTGDASLPVTEHREVSFADFLVTQQELDETARLQIQAFFVEGDSTQVTGGALIEPLREAVLAPFSGADQGWSLDVAVHTIGERITLDMPAGGGTLNLRARFYLSDGARLERDFSVRLVCSQDSALALCDAACTATLTDANHCGKCNVSCEGPRPSCQQGVCYPCPKNQILCDGQCISPDDDDGNCGACGIVCTGEGARCDSGLCSTCAANERYCGGGCIDVMNDTNNCGACGNRCDGPDAACEDGACVTCASEPHKTACNTAWCSDLSLDESNCGACGHQCTDYNLGAPYRNECIASKCHAEAQSTAATAYHQTCREICEGAGMQCGSKVFPADYRCPEIGPATGFQRYRTHSGTSVYQCFSLGCDSQPLSTASRVDPLKVCVCEASP